MSKFTLKTGLENYINLVEQLGDHTEFSMSNYHGCVIGQTTGFSGGTLKTIKRQFGFDVSPDLDKVTPDSDGDRWTRLPLTMRAQTRYGTPLYTPEQWDVIRLFTCDVGAYITKYEWLKLAKQQLSKMS